MAVKIGVMGAHGCGKTTLVAGIVDDLSKGPGLIVVSAGEVARECPHGINEEMTLESSRWMIQAQVEIESASVKIADIVVCDRTIIDPLIYAEWMFDRTGDTDWRLFINARIGLALDWFNSYDFVFWCRPWYESMVQRCLWLKDADGVRSQCLSFQRDIDMIFERYVGRYKLETTQGRLYDFTQIKEVCYAEGFREKTCSSR
jgi:hypothetical protein